MARTFTVVTCRKAKILTGSAPRAYGYTILIDPPIERFDDGMCDVEGIGLVKAAHAQTVRQRWTGWYKFKDMAEQRAEEKNQG